MNDSHRLPVGDHTYYHSRYFIEDDTVPEYTHASPAAYEAFRDIKYGIRIHWGLYSLLRSSGKCYRLDLVNDGRLA